MNRNTLKTSLRLVVIQVIAGCALAGTLAGQDRPVEKEPATPRPPAREQYFQTMVIEQGATSGTVNCMFCSVVIRGTLDGEAVAIWGNVDVEGTVKGEATSVAGSVRLRSGSHVTGDVTAVAGRVEQESGAIVDGDTTSLSYLFFPGQRDMFTTGLPIFLAVHLCLVFLVFAIFRARRVRGIGAALQQRPFFTILAGLAAYAVVISASSFLNLGGWLDMFVSLGLPLLLMLIAIPGMVGMGFLLGRRFIGDDVSVNAALLGTVLLVALSAIPLAGLLFYTVTGMLSAGAALVSRFGYFAPPPGKAMDSSGANPAA